MYLLNVLPLHTRCIQVVFKIKKVPCIFESTPLRTKCIPLILKVVVYKCSSVGICVPLLFKIKKIVPCILECAPTTILERTSFSVKIKKTNFHRLLLSQFYIKYIEFHMYIFTSHAYQSCVPVMRTSHVYQSCVPVMRTSHHVYQSS